MQDAAAALWRNSERSLRIHGLPEHCRPSDRAEGDAIQERLATASGQRVIGWKIAATSLAGQAHIHVDGPLAGRLLDGRVLEGGAAVSLEGNSMRVAEAEFAFRFGKSLGRREQPYSADEVIDAVESLHPAIEVPDSRYEDYKIVGAPQLIADNACACWFLLGRAAGVNWRDYDLVQHQVVAFRNGEVQGRGSGAGVLGDPRNALVWIANELSRFGNGLLAGEVVTTGTITTPVPVRPGDRVRIDFGDFGAIDASFS